jgi:hypothetical protein
MVKKQKRIYLRGPAFQHITELDYWLARNKMVFMGHKVYSAAFIVSMPYRTVLNHLRTETLFPASWEKE